MRSLVLAILCLAGLAQDSPVVRGVVVRRELGIKSGVLTVRVTDDRVLRFRFDTQTYVERENRPIDAERLRAGDKVEIVSDALPGAAMRTAQSIHVLTPKLVERRPPPIETPKGDLTFSGLILRLGNSRLVLHQRDNENVEIVLRPDTRYLDNGESVAAQNLKPNMRVSVRGSKNVAGNVEAYQVVWGSMLAPK
jgi:hypothetical protein